MIDYQIDSLLRTTLTERLNFFMSYIEAGAYSKDIAYEYYKDFLRLLELDNKDYEECIRFGVDFLNM